MQVKLVTEKSKIMDGYVLKMFIKLNKILITSSGISEKTVNIMLTLILPKNIQVSFLRHTRPKIC